MRLLIIALVTLGFACTPKEAPPAEPEATEAEVTQVAEEVEVAEPADPGEAPEAAEEEGLGELPPLPGVLLGKTPELGSAPTVVVENAGADPKKKLAFALKPGTSSASVAVGLEIEAVVALFGVKSPRYTVSYDLALTTKKAKKGAFVVEVAVNQATFDEKTIGKPRRLAQIEAAAKSMKKVKGSYVLSANGVVTKLNLTLPDSEIKALKAVPGAGRTALDMVETIRWAILQLTPAFPDEPIGAGATWTVQRSLTQAGIIIHQLATYELVSAEGGTVALSVGTRQGAEEQMYQNPGMRNDLKLTVLNGTGEGTVRWRADDALPTTANVESTVVKGVRQLSDKADQAPVDSAVQTKRSATMGKL
ncbi:MAG: hypothetical protein AAF500_13800 [Myxococcota bacterium]